MISSRFSVFSSARMPWELVRVVIPSPLPVDGSGKRVLPLVRPRAGQDGGPAQRAQRERLLDRVAAGQAEGRPCCKRVAAAVCIGDRAGWFDGLVGPLVATRRAPAPALRPGGPDAELRLG